MATHKYGTRIATAQGGGSAAPGGVQQTRTTDPVLNMFKTMLGRDDGPKRAKAWNTISELTVPALKSGRVQTKLITAVQKFAVRYSTREEEGGGPTHLLTALKRVGLAQDHTGSSLYISYKKPALYQLVCAPVISSLKLAAADKEYKNLFACWRENYVLLGYVSCGRFASAQRADYLIGNTAGKLFFPGKGGVLTIVGVEGETSSIGFGKQKSTGKIVYAPLKTPAPAAAEGERKDGGSLFADRPRPAGNNQAVVEGATAQDVASVAATVVSPPPRAPTEVAAGVSPDSVAVEVVLDDADRGEVRDTMNGAPEPPTQTASATPATPAVSVSVHGRETVAGEGDGREGTLEPNTPLPPAAMAVEAASASDSLPRCPQAPTRAESFHASMHEVGVERAPPAHAEATAAQSRTAGLGQGVLPVSRTPQAASEAVVGAGPRRDGAVAAAVEVVERQPPGVAEPGTPLPPGSPVDSPVSTQGDVTPKLLEQASQRPVGEVGAMAALATPSPPARDTQPSVSTGSSSSASSQSRSNFFSPAGANGVSSGMGAPQSASSAATARSGTRALVESLRSAASESLGASVQSGASAAAAARASAQSRRDGGGLFSSPPPHEPSPWPVTPPGTAQALVPEGSVSMVTSPFSAGASPIDGNRSPATPLPPARLHDSQTKRLEKAKQEAGGLLVETRKGEELLKSRKEKVEKMRQLILEMVMGGLRQFHKRHEGHRVVYEGTLVPVQPYRDAGGLLAVVAPPGVDGGDEYV